LGAKAVKSGRFARRIGDHARMRRVVPLLMLAAVLAGCGGTAPGPVGGGSAQPATNPAADQPAPSPGADPSERALPVYYVAQTAAGPRLQREFHRLPAADPATAAVREMLAHPSGTDPDYRNPWPAGTTLRGPVASTADAITVDLTAAPPSELAAQQLVFTVQGALGSTTPVQLRKDGVPTGPPIPRGDPYALRSLVQIDAPADGASAASPVAVTGEAAVFEATLHWTVLSGSTTVRTGVTSTAEGQTFAPFRFSLDLPPGRYTVRISEDDPSDGAGRPVLTDDRTLTIT
jgi:Immunoglobulin-like domain of bacterial spore germination/Sporulation and spore germination